MSSTLDQVRASIRVNLPPYLRIEATAALYGRYLEWYELRLGGLALIYIHRWPDDSGTERWNLIRPGRDHHAINAPDFATPGEAIDWFYRHWILCE